MTLDHTGRLPYIQGGNLEFKGGLDRDANGVPYSYGNAAARKAYAARMRKSQKRAKRMTGKPGTSDGK